MKSSDVIGRKIVKVRQTRRYNEATRRFYFEVEGFVLDDGTRIVLLAHDDGSDLYCTAATTKGSAR